MGGCGAQMNRSRCCLRKSSWFGSGLHEESHVLSLLALQGVLRKGGLSRFCERMKQHVRG